MKRLLALLLLIPALALAQVTTNPGVTGVFNPASPGPIGANSASSGAFTTITATSTITPSQTSGIVGTTTNNSANAGSVGEYVTSTVASGSAVSVTSSAAKTVTSIPLTAGDWDVCGFVKFTGGATTNVTQNLAGLQTTTDTLPADGERALVTFGAAGLVAYPADNPSITVPCQRALLSGSATYYLIAYSVFTISTTAAYGRLWARRMR